MAETRDLLDALDSDITFSLPNWKQNDDPEQRAEELRSVLGISIEKQMQDF